MNTTAVKERPIKFRGLCKSGWLIGDLVRGDYTSLIFPYSADFVDILARIEDYVVDTKTVGQFTGFHDKDGKEIYEGDILKSEHFHVGKTEYYLHHRVCWDESHTGWVAVSMSNKDYDLTQSGNAQLWVYFRNAVNPIVIGNIYQNPELMEDKEKF